MFLYRVYIKKINFKTFITICCFSTPEEVQKKERNVALFCIKFLLTCRPFYL